MGKCILELEPFDAVVAVRDSEGEACLWGFPRVTDAESFAELVRGMGLEAIVGFPVQRIAG